jgi:peptidoglycan/LPS O-acetylase OafA/YrhL
MNLAETSAARLGLPVASEKYVAELDGIRALAVSFVVFAHYRLVPLVPGGFGVTLFFFLSGYLITTLFYAEYGLTRRISIPQFYLRRWLRLTPPLVISVILAAVFYGVSRNAVGSTPVPPGTALAALFYYTNYYDLAWAMDPARVIPFGVCWSLAIEEHFYLFWPWLLRRNLPSANRMLVIVASICAAVLVWRAIVRFGFQAPSEYTYMATDCRIDSIMYGALLRIAFESGWASNALRVLQAPACRVLALLALLATFVVRNDDFRETIRYSIQGLALMPVFTAVLCSNPRTLARRFLAHPAMVLIGRLSYSIYLFHLMARTPGEVYFGSPFGWPATISGLLLTAAISYGLFIFVERPLGRLRHRFRAHGGIARTPKAVEPVIAPSLPVLTQEPGLGS